MTPLVTVITPTFNRRRVLLERCIPSVAAQDYPAVEHIVVSDGPDPELRAALAGTAVRYAESLHGGHWGHLARLLGISMARGEYIAWLDDDDAYRPDHVRLHASALDENPAAGFAYSRLLIGAQDANARRYADDPDECLGTDDCRPGQILTSMLFHRRSVLETATWATGTLNPDRDLVEAWVSAGVGWVSIPQVSCWMFTHDDYEHHDVPLPPWLA